MPQCADCGAKNPYLIDYMGNGIMVCEHRYACEARQMLKVGVSIEKVAAYAQKPRSW